MTRFTTVPADRASGRTKELYGAVRQTLGSIPNLFLGLGVSPAALEGFLATGEALKHGQLSVAEREAIALVVSEVNACQYCLAAHSTLGKMAGLGDDDMLGIRRGSEGPLKVRALIVFTRAVLTRQGRISDVTLQAVRDAGYSDAQLIEAILVMAQTTFTNLYNNLNATEVDFPEAALI